MWKPCDADLMKAYEVSRAVNRVLHDTPGMLDGDASVGTG